MNAKVTVYTTRTCPYCHAAKKFLEDKKIAYTEVDVSSDDAMRTKLIKMSGQQTVPQIFSGDKSIGGYDDLVAYYRSGKQL